MELRTQEAKIVNDMLNQKKNERNAKPYECNKSCITLLKLLNSPEIHKM